MDGTERVHVDCFTAMIDIVVGCASIPARLFFLFVAAGTKVGDEIFGLGFLEDVREWRHGVTTLKDLNSYLSFVQAASYAGEIGAFVAALLTDGVAMFTAVICEDLGSTGALLG
jgi:hypothetical protein